MHIREADFLEDGYVYRGVQMVILDAEFLTIFEKRVVDRSAISRRTTGSFYKPVFTGIAKAARLLVWIVVYGNEPASWFQTAVNYPGHGA